MGGHNSIRNSALLQGWGKEAVYEPRDREGCLERDTCQELWVLVERYIKASEEGRLGSEFFLAFVHFLEASGRQESLVHTCQAPSVQRARLKRVERGSQKAGGRYPMQWKLESYFTEVVCSHFCSLDALAKQVQNNKIFLNNSFYTAEELIKTM